MKFLAIPGSLRRGSYNRGLLRTAALLAPEGMTVDVDDGLAAVPAFDEDLEHLEAGGPGPVRGLRARIAASDGLLIATPEYNQSFPGVLKNALDWLSRPAPEEVLSGKPVAILGATSGRWGTRLAQAGLRQVLAATGALVLPAPALYVREAERLFDPEGKLTDPATTGALRDLLLAFRDWVVRVGATPSTVAP